MDRILRERASVLENYRLLRLSYPALPGVLRDFQVLYKILRVIVKTHENRE